MVQEARNHKKRIWILGQDGLVVRTPVVKNVAAGDPTNPRICTEVEISGAEHSFEFRGSYRDLEESKLLMEVWNWSSYRVNKLDSQAQDTLQTFASGSVFNEYDLVSPDHREKLPRGKLSFQLFFQEVYDFELSFLDWKMAEIPGLRLSEKDKKGLAQSTGGGAMMGFSLGGKGLVNSRGTERNRASRGTVTSSFGVASNTFGEDQPVFEMDQEQAADDDDDDGLISTRRVQCCGYGLQRGSREQNKGEATWKNLEIASTSGQSDFGGKIRVMSKPQKFASEASWETLGNIYFRGTINDLENTSIEITVHSKESIATGSSPQVKKPLQHQGSYDSFDEARKTRATVREAIASTMDVELYRMVKVPVGHTIIPLRGILDYGFCKGDFAGTKEFQAEMFRANYEQSALAGLPFDPLALGSNPEYEEALQRFREDFSRMKFGKVEGKVTIDAQPRYRQKGDVMALDQSKRYLMVRVSSSFSIGTGSEPVSERIVSDFFLGSIYPRVFQSSTHICLN